MEVFGQASLKIFHDLNNFIQVIEGYSEIIYLETDKETVLEYVQIITDMSEQLRALPNGMLDLNRKMHSTAQTNQMNFKSFCENNRKLFNSILPSGIEFDITYPDHEVKIPIPPSKFNQICMNLILNAKDAIHHAGRIDVNIELKDDKVELVCHDTGEGIPEDQQSKILQPFYTTKEQGTGLGLSIVQEIVSDYSSTIKLESEPGNTKFIITFPVE